METPGSTLIQIAQGVGIGIGILALGAGLILSATGDGTMVSLTTSAAVYELGAPTWPTPAVETDTLDASAAPPAQSAAASPLPAGDADPALPGDAARVYYNQVAADLSLLVVSTMRLERLLAQPAPLEMGWRTEVVQQEDAAHTAAAGLSRVQPASSVETTHARLMTSTRRCLTVMEALKDNLEKIPADSFVLVGETLAGCSGDVAAVLRLVNSGAVAGR